MQQDHSQVITDPGSIIYIPDTVQVGLYAQGVDTYSLTGLLLDVICLQDMDGGMLTYGAYTVYQGIPAYFRDLGTGMTPGGNTRTVQAHWWIEPVSETSMDSSYFAVKPELSVMEDDIECYWTTICCDFPIFIPENGGVEGAYTVKEVVMGCDSLYYAEPVKICGQGEIVPAATPVLFKCTSPEVSDCKLLPVGDIANHRAMPIANDLLMGNYFSLFINHSSMSKADIWDEYIPEQATEAAATHLALGADADGKLGFFPMPDTAYMVANSAWLSIADLELDGVTAVYLGKAPVADPEPEPVEKGDVNGDGVLSIADVTNLINYLISAPDGEEETGKSDAALINISAADLNDDNIVNITDLSLLISKLMSMVD